MTAVNLKTVMDGLATGLATISGLKVYAFPPKSAQTPFAFVDMPSGIDYDSTYGRGQDRMSLRVFVCVANNVDSELYQQLCAYAASTGSKSIKTAIDVSGEAAGTSVRVQRVEFRPVSVAGSTYAGAIFTVDVAA